MQSFKIRFVGDACIDACSRGQQGQFSLMPSENEHSSLKFTFILPLFFLSCPPYPGMQQAPIVSIFIHCILSYCFRHVGLFQCVKIAFQGVVLKIAYTKLHVDKLSDKCIITSIFKKVAKEGTDFYLEL